MKWLIERSFQTGDLGSLIAGGNKTESINQAAINGEPVFTFHTRSKGTADFEALTREISGLEG
ncbi:hypothetical protein [Endozoicomonas numazuensis]|uniref:Uncharacterized protein n=1 Tax=Endozoicomonas numazuensis TaxID=1137799 RepID=A0A081N9A7_9GAMM|nr:hypothetical protein [Endozoicomonas numazuensis]KEQ15030.1 hypothetical protein GZ78_24420 [Endozoicomonas numazuensis]